MYQSNDAWFSDLENWHLDGESSSSSVSISDDLRLEPGLGDWPFNQDSTDILMLTNRISSKEWLWWENCLRKHLIIIRCLLIYFTCKLTYFAYAYSNMIRVFVYIDNQQKYRCYLPNRQRYYFLARTYSYRSVFLAVFLIERK